MDKIVFARPIAPRYLGTPAYFGRLRRGLQKISVGISLVVLSVGFYFLGLLSFFSKADTDHVASTATVSLIAGSSASLLTGTTFLVASCVYWSRHQ